MFMFLVKCVMKRYNRETLEVTYKGKNIADILEMTVEEATQFFDIFARLSASYKH